MLQLDIPELPELSSAEQCEIRGGYAPLQDDALDFVCALPRFRYPPPGWPAPWPVCPIDGAW